MNSIEQRKAELKKELERLEALESWEKYPKLSKYLVEQGFEIEENLCASKALSDRFAIQIEIAYGEFYFVVYDKLSEWFGIESQTFLSEEEFFEALKNLKLPKKYKVTGNFEAYVYSYNISEVEAELTKVLGSLETNCEDEFMLHDWKDSVVIEEVK